MKLFTALALLCFAAPATADVVLTKTVHVDAVQTPKGEVPAKDETQTVWLAKDKVRLEGANGTYIVRLDQKKLYVLSPGDQSYAVLDIPINIAKYLPAELAALYPEAKARTHITASITPSDETQRIKGWSAKRYTMQLSSMGETSTDTVWTTKDIEVDWATFWDAQRAIASATTGHEELAEEMKKLDGVTVKADRVRTNGTVKTHIVEELVSAERKEAPAGAYDIPAGFTEKPFNPASIRKMIGQRPGDASGEAAPHRGEAKDGDKPAGDGSKRRKEAGGDDKDKTGDGSKRREKQGGDDKGGG